MTPPSHPQDNRIAADHWQRFFNATPSLSLPPMTNPRLAAQRAYRERKDLLLAAQHERTIRIINSTIGEFRLFQGTMAIGDFAEGYLLTDADHLHDMWGAFTAGKAAVYWADGSRQWDASGDAALGAGVSWQVQDERGEWWYESKKFALGHETGESADAELFGIAAAFRLAVEAVEQQQEIERVRVFSDCATVLEGIQEGSIMTLGPAVGAIWALQEVYDCVDLLVGMGVEVELAWVKGHARSEGNNAADSAADAGAKMQGVRGKRGFVKKKDVPELIAKMGQDSVEEWYWRANKERLLRGEEEGKDEEAELPQPPTPPPNPGHNSDTSSQGSADMDISSSDSE